VKDYCKLRNYVRLGSGVELSQDVFLNCYSSMGDNAFCGAGSIFDSYSSMQSTSRTEAKAYLGKYSQVGSNSLIGKNAVIHKYALVHDGETVPKGEVRIRTPSSTDLCSDCLSLNQIQQSNIDQVLNTSVADASNFLFDLMERHFDQMQQSCPSFDFESLRLVKSLYMLRFYGLEGYKKNCQRRTSTNFNFNNIKIVRNIFINGKRITNDFQSSPDEHHFGSNDTRDIIDNRAKNAIITLLAIEHDAQRNSDLRVNGDGICKMLEDIISGRRPVRCDS